MERLFTLPIIAALTLVGVGAGVQLGQGAANAINPFYSTPVPPRAVAATIAQSGQRPVVLSQADSRAALGGCVGCRTYPEEYVPGSSLEQQMPDEYYAASLGAPRGYRVAVETGFEQEAPDPAPDESLADVERYASYPVTEHERDLREAEMRAAALSRTPDVPEERAEAPGLEQLIY